MNKITITHLETEEEIYVVLKYCAPYFHNQSYNDPDVIRKLSKKFYAYGNVIKATCEDNLLGFCAYYANDLEGHNAFLSMIIVVSSAQGSGVGKELLNKLIYDCRSKGMLHIRLEVADDNNRAIRFYEKNNFVFERKLSDTTCQYALDL